MLKPDKKIVDDAQKHRKTRYDAEQLYVRHLMEKGVLSCRETVSVQILIRDGKVVSAKKQVSLHEGGE